MHALIVRFDVLADRLDDFDELVGRTLAGIAAHEPGTRVYLTGSPVAGGRVFIEVYEDEAAFAAHESQPYVQSFLELRAPMLRSVTVDVLPGVDGVMH